MQNNFGSIQRNDSHFVTSKQTREILFLDFASSPGSFASPHPVMSKNKPKLLTEFDSSIFSKYTLLLIVCGFGFFRNTALIWNIILNHPKSVPKAKLTFWKGPCSCTPPMVPRRNKPRCFLALSFGFGWKQLLPRRVWTRKRVDGEAAFVPPHVLSL